MSGTPWEPGMSPPPPPRRSNDLALKIIVNFVVYAALIAGLIVMYEIVQQARVAG